jgi:hypothetical protein
MSFDAAAFMGTTMDRQLETEVKLVPTGEYEAMIGNFDESAFQAYEFEYKKGDRAGQPGEMVNFSIPFVIQDTRAAEAVGRLDGICQVYKRVVLDFDANGQLDTGVNRNVELGQVRDAVGQNNPGPWNVGELRGAGPCRIKVEHRTGKRKDGSPFKTAEVTRVVAIRR